MSSQLKSRTRDEGIVKASVNSAIISSFCDEALKLPRKTMIRWHARDPKPGDLSMSRVKRR